MPAQTKAPAAPIDYQAVFIACREAAAQLKTPPALHEGSLDNMQKMGLLALASAIMTIGAEARPKASALELA